MATTYIKSLSSDFGGNLNPSLLLDEINDNTNISLTCINITNIADNVNIVFESSLDSGEQTILDNIISLHSPSNNKPKVKSFVVTPDIAEFDNSIYRLISIFNYAGKDSIGDLDYIEYIGLISNENSTYDIRAYDSTNNKIIAEKTGNNNKKMQIIDLGELSNIPSESAIIEIQGRVISSNNAKLHNHQVVIYYDN